MSTGHEDDPRAELHRLVDALPVEVVRYAHGRINDLAETAPADPDAVLASFASLYGESISDEAIAWAAEQADHVASR